MKKTVLLLLLSALVLSGCGKEKEPPRMEVPILTEAPTTPAETTAPPTVPDETEPVTQAPTESPTEAAEEVPQESAPAVVSGKVANTPFVNVRVGPSTNVKVAKKLQEGDPVEVSLGVTLDKVTWAKIQDGWVSAAYLDLDGPIPRPQGKEASGTPGVIFYTEDLNVRAEPSVSADKVGTLHRSDVVVVYETKSAGGGLWGRIDDGWVGMDYVVMEAPQTEQPGKPLAGSNGMTAPPETQATYPDLEAPEIIGPFDGVHVHPDYRPENQKPCQHPSWKHVDHFPERYKEWDEYTCSCGEVMYNEPSMQIHVEVASKENPGAHTGYTHQHFKEYVGPCQDNWECEVCGVIKTTYNGEQP